MHAEASLVAAERRRKATHLLIQDVRTAFWRTASAQRLLDDGSVETVSVRRLLVGDRVRVPVGQAFPADGVLVEGDTQADESLLTGESRPVPRPCGAASRMKSWPPASGSRAWGNWWTAASRPTAWSPSATERSDR